MAHKVKDLLKALEKKVHNDELSSIVSASSLDDVDITDEGWAAMLADITALMSKDAAVNNTEVIDEIVDSAKGKIVQKTLHNVETRLKSFASKTGVDLGEAKKAHEMLNVFDEKAVEVFKNDDGKTQTLIDSYKTDLGKLNGEIDGLRTDHKAELEVLQKDFDIRELKTQFELQAKSQNWADSYAIPAVNKALTDQIWNEAKSQATLKFEDGEIKPYNKENPDKEFYLDNKKATFEDLINPKFEPYLKKSAPAQQRVGIQAQTNGTEGQTTAEQNRGIMERAHPIQE